jgi:hypothetical protein
MMNDKMKEALEMFEKQKISTLERIDLLMQEEMLDEDGYPTEEALEIIQIWPFDKDNQEWFGFINSIWHLKSWGWSEGLNPSDMPGVDLEGKQRYQYHISTGGWSGNESIIRAMESNSMMWHLHWVQSRRGGHYIFEQRDC